MSANNQYHSLGCSASSLGSLLYPELAPDHFAWVRTNAASGFEHLHFHSLYNFLIHTTYLGTTGSIGVPFAFRREDFVGGDLRAYCYINGFAHRLPVRETTDGLLVFYFAAENLSVHALFPIESSFNFIVAPASDVP
jgi:hypothetical protein